MAKGLQRIQTWRFRINLDSLQATNIAYLDFPWLRVVDTFRKEMARFQNRRSIRDTDRPPWRALATALNLGACFVRPFHQYGRDPAIALGDMGLPAVEHLAEITRDWLRWYARRHFGDELAQMGDYLRDTLDQITSEGQSWQTRAIPQIMKDDACKEYRVIFDALPSVIARRLAGQTFKQPGRYGNLTWHLTQEGTQFGIVSDLVQAPVPGRQARSGHFAYHLTFDVETMPGEMVPVIDMRVHCRRYVEDPEPYLGSRSCRVAVATNPSSPWITGWPEKPEVVMIPVWMRWSGRYVWADWTADFYQEVNARELADPNSIAASPQEYWNPDQHGDRYYILYREGIGHPLNSGFSVAEQYAIWETVRSQTQGLLTPLDELGQDDGLWKWKRPFAVVAPRQVKDRKSDYVYDPSSCRMRTESVEPATRIQQAWERAYHREQLPIRVLLFHRTQGVRDKVLSQVQDLLTDQAVEIVELDPVLEALVEPLVAEDEDAFDFAALDQSRSKAKYELRGQLRRLVRTRFDQRVRDWGKHLDLVLDKHPRARLAFIEVPPHQDLRYDWLSAKGPIREAFAVRGLSTQLITSQQKGERPYRVGRTEWHDVLNRARAATNDLLVRHPALLYGELRNVYHKLGFPDTLAENLVIVGLTRCRKNAPHYIDCCVAVRLHPSSRAELWLPGGDQWIPYVDGPREVIKLFKRHRLARRRGQSPLNMDRLAIRAFLERMVTTRPGLAPDTPVLYVLDASDFRQSNTWRALQNPHLAKDKLSFDYWDDHQDWLPPAHTRDYSPDELPGVRIVRLRIGESPPGFDIHQMSDACGLFPLENRVFPMYLSFGEIPGADPEKTDVFKADGGGAMAFKHPSPVEICPFFLQQEDSEFDPVLWARLIHLLRYAPGWGKGETVRPYPAHLAWQIMDDYVCTQAELDWEE